LIIQYSLFCIQVLPMSMIHEITAAAPKNKRGIRKGRGRATGRGKTSGRGTKGSGAHGGDVHWIPGREGGQTPLFRRLPKRGFSNENFESRFHIVNLSDLNAFDADTTVDAGALIAAGLVPDDRLPVKVLGDGKLDRKLTVVAGWYSKSAVEKIGAAGGAAQNVKGEAFEFPKAKFKKRDVKYKPPVEDAAPEAAPAAEAPAAEEK
jgi:large subunit ribosomal protein L15